MRVTVQLMSGAILASALALPAGGQTAAVAGEGTQDSSQQSWLAGPVASQLDSSAAPAAHAVEQLLGFKDSDVKFDLGALMETLRDRRHEGWVLAAYPDPKTGHPLIGAGFSLDLPARDHPQLDPLNPHPFLEPSSAELWQAAGLDSQRLQTLLAQYHTRLAAWSPRGFRRKINALAPQITDDEATLLLRVAAIQSIYNAKGYCRDFDRLTASQQMAMSQLVYQMGVNLQEFNQFLGLVNNHAASADANAAEYWKAVQQSLVQSQWARLYRARAVAVIAMLDPKYVDQPGVAEQRVGAMLRPAVLHRRAGQGRSGRAVRTRKLRQQKRRGV